MWQKLVTVLILFFFFFIPQIVHADEGWKIDHFQSDIALQNSGEVRVVETIEADFGNVSKHGIYRDIPYVYQADGQETYTSIHVSSVLQNQQKAKYQISQENGYYRIKVGDPERTISGKTIYTITYVAKGVLRAVNDHDELYWNVTGNWPVVIGNTEATVTMDKLGMQKAICYQGEIGGTNLCGSVLQSQQIASFSSITPLLPQQQMTVAVAYKKGIIPILTVERPKSIWEQFVEWPSLSTLIFVIIASVVTVFYRWARFGRDYWFGQNIFGKSTDEGELKPLGSHETTTVEFLPPQKLRPAEIGVLIDERAGTTDIVATIIDLATRGFLTITEIPKKWMFGNVDYELQKKEKDESELVAYEKKLYGNLFKSGTTIKMSELRNTFYKDLQEVKTELYNDVVAKKLFPLSPEKVRSNQFGIGAVFLFIGIILFWLSMTLSFVLLFDLSIGSFVSAFLFFYMAQFMPRRTAYGRELYRRVKGYRLFLATAEKHRQVFFERRNMFNEVLPYVIMFGLTEKFAKQMQEIGIKPSTTDWYTGSHPITSPAFASSINNFSSSMSTAIASTPSSSGGFSGGSSGGGFGGGGGGSW